MTELRVYANSAVGGIPMAIYWGLGVAFCLGLVLLLWWKGLREGLRNSTILLLAEWVFLVLCASVLFRESGEDYRFNLIPLSSYFDYGENSYLMEKAALNILNVVLFFPVGLLIGCGFRKMTWRKVLAIGVTLSASIELLQLLFRKGLCETDDIIHNVAGCMIGYGVALLLKLLHTDFTEYTE